MSVTSLCQPAVYGVNTSEEPMRILRDNAGHYIQQAGNLRIHNNRWRTAYRWRELQGYGDDLELWQSLHTQNAIWYLPRSGQGTNYIGVGNPRIVESAAGRLFTLEIKNDMFEVVDISGGKVSYPWFRLAWLAQGENYVVRTDGKSQTQIWDGKNPVFFSTGYSAAATAGARFPNFAGPTVYAGGRFWTVLFGNRIYAGDSLHQLDQVGASDILKFTDQTYDYIRVYFAPPSSEGLITALTVSISSGFDDSRAQGEVLAMCDSPAIWGVQIGIPRQEWPTARMRHPRSKETAAAGPNAFFVRDGDILMRTPLGIESINLLARFQNTLGNPTIDLGADMKAILSKDDEPSLLFASLINPVKWNRMLCTVSPRIKGPRHWHQGWISANFNPLGIRIPQGFAWEGIGTIPCKMGKVVQFLEARFDGKTHVVALLDKGDGTGKGLARVTQEEGPHILADGTVCPVSWYLMTKRLIISDSNSETNFCNAWIRLDEMKSDVSLEVWTRCSTAMNWKLVRVVEVQALLAPDSTFGTCPTAAERTIALGAITAQQKGALWAQFLIKGKGVCTVDFSIDAGDAVDPNEKPDAECLKADSPPFCSFDPFYTAN